MASTRPTSNGTTGTTGTTQPISRQDRIIANNPARRQPLTDANLSVHETHMDASPSGPTPMQRWYTDDTDVAVRGRTTTRSWDNIVDQDELAAEIDRIVEGMSKGKPSQEK